MAEQPGFITVELKTESGEIFRVPVLRDADEIEIYFYPRESGARRDVFCLTTKRLREDRQTAFSCFGSRCAMCGKPYIRGDSTAVCDECSTKQF